MSEHTPGPLEYLGKDRNDQPQLIGRDGQLVAVCAHECLTSREPEAEANAHHIIACWNACEGLNPEGVRELLEAAKGGLEFAEDQEDVTGSGYPNAAMQLASQLRAAIAKVEGR
jgi:hypothetical protein